ncbi:CHAP domain-containing protein [Luteipulveratus mongoliensis]|uniref:CHAP domain-containing protein n=1 Tax=Luteipulveratus mongoliensis TaxID=571913 RepID=UPI00069627CC|nr:CHAP domain-containing protein [Luteipulveratus mongoliensis]
MKNTKTIRRSAAVGLTMALAGGGALAVASQSDAAPGKVHTASSSLTVRSGPSAGAKAVGSLKKGAKVDIKCQTYGTTVKGTYGTSNVWDRIGTGRYVSDAYIYTGSDGFVAPKCGGTSTPKPPPSSNKGRKWGKTASYNGGASGQCTWGAKEKFKKYSGKYPAIYGNAKDWFGSAKANGGTTTYTPSANAIVVFQPGAQGANRTYGHVAWVNSVQKTSHGTYVHITEMNWKGKYIYNTRTVKDVSGMGYILAPHK